MALLSNINLAIKYTQDYNKDNNNYHYSPSRDWQKNFVKSHRVNTLSSEGLIWYLWYIGVFKTILQICKNQSAVRPYRNRPQQMPVHLPVLR